MRRNRLSDPHCSDRIDLPSPLQLTEELIRVHQLIAGHRRDGGSAETFDVTDPSTGETVEQVGLADAGDVDAAVSAARAAFPGWSSAPPVERSAALTRMAAVLEGRADELARTETRQTGKPIRLSTGFDVPGTIDNVSFFAGAARDLEGKAAGEYSGDHTSYVRREAVGVVGSIAPWNYPLQMAAWKALPDDIKAVLHSMAREWTWDQIQRVAVDDVRVAKELAAKNIKTDSWDDELMKKMRELAMKTWEDWSKKTPLAKQAYDSQLAWLKDLGVVA